MTAGFIGLGIMGSRMAANLLKKDFDVVVYNRTLEKAAALADIGAAWLDTPAEVGRKADILFTMLATPDAVRQTAMGPDGFLDHLKPGTLWVDCSTVNPSFSKQMAKKAARRNIRFVDAPVAGTKDPARDAELVFFSGGESEDIESVRPHLEAMGRKILHVGPQGMGCAMKMVFNLMLGVAMAAFSEAVHLGQAMGVDSDILIDTLAGSPVAAPFLALKKDMIKTGDFEAAFPLKWMQKDLHLAGLSGYENSVPLPLTGLSKDMYMAAVQKGLDDDDFAAIFKLFNTDKPQK